MKALAAGARLALVHNEDGTRDVVRICDEHGTVSLPVPDYMDPMPCDGCEARQARFRYSRALTEHPEWFK